MLFGDEHVPLGILIDDLLTVPEPIETEIVCVEEVVFVMLNPTVPLPASIEFKTTELFK